MNIYPKNFETKIGFDKIKELLEENCESSLGKHLVQEMSFSSSKIEVETKLNQTNEFRNILLFENSFPTGNYINLIPVFQNLRPEGAVISVEEVFDLRLSLQTISDILKFFTSERQETYPQLAILLEKVYLPESILNRCVELIDERAQIRDTASDELFRIRKALISKSSSLRNKIYKSLQQAKESGWTRADAEITLRDGRAVIPMYAADKRKIKGFMHDESMTGQTVYLEPTELFDANNEIRELQFAEKREINKILSEFSYQIREYLEPLIESYYFLGMMDFIRSKARLAVEVNAIKPLLSENLAFDWRKAVHPLLLISHRKKKNPVVPLNIGLDEKKHILIISGPNAGGKSVCLKTVGLLQYMFQCGMLIPMGENSEVAIFDKIFIDIGDEQSIENDLSTYSSHLSNIRFFIENCDDKTLFLIDELGSGTEPGIGGAIAEAALEMMHNKNSFGVVTTHYSNLKAMSNEENKFVNGAMLYDTTALKPMYQLSIGKPGSSFAFEIARKIGMPEEILDLAYSKSGRQEIDLEARLAEVAFAQEEVGRKLKEVEQADSLLNEVILKYQSLSQSVDLKKREIVAEAKLKAKEILNQSNRLIENAIREIKEADADKERTNQIRQDVEKQKDKLMHDLEAIVEKKIIKASIPKTPVKVKKLNTEPLKEGDWARVSGQETVGKIETIKGKLAVISFDSVRISCELERLEKAEIPNTKRTQKSAFSSIMQNINARASNFSPTIDLRGKRADEALSEVKKLIDEAVLLSFKELEILHGTGNGILRQVIRDYLSGHEDVKSFHDAKIEFGGTGKTMISL